jgi:AmmeMemoRadiSam system protein B
MSEPSDIRPSPIAGTWYSGSPDRLTKEVDAFIQAAKLPELNGQVVAIITPHAGLRYSGRTAGYAFRAILGQPFDMVVILSPYHNYIPASIITTTHTAYDTPLGSVAIDKPALDELKQQLQQACVEWVAVANDQEHSVEIELPFLQRALPGNFTILPLMLRQHDANTLKKVASALAKTVKDRSCLLVASTDLSHFFPQPEAEKLDAEMLRQMAVFSPEGVLQAEQHGTGYACGAPAVAVALWAALELGADQVKLLHHSTSGDETGDYSSVVGYGAAVVLKIP